MVFAIIALAIALAISYFVAGWFYEVVEAKGYDNKKYFWICFWLGIVGYLLVIALPNRYEEIQNSEKCGTTEEIHTTCPHCERKVIIPEGTVKAVCPWCNKKIDL